MELARQPRILSTTLRLAIAVTAVILPVALTASRAHAQTETVLHQFTGRGDGASPLAGVTFDQQGRIYGTTVSGGTYQDGVVYRLVHEGEGWVLSPIYTFRGHSDGSSPYSRVIFGPGGLLYGTTFQGGSTNNGTVFSLQPPASACKSVLCPWIETILYNFTGGADGGAPYYGDLTFDQAGNIYGTTYLGGDSGNGVVFKLTRSGNSWIESVLWNFTGGSDGASPFSGVIFDNAGNLYGTTSSGGSGYNGTVYELSSAQSGWSETTLYSFIAADNGTGAPGLVIDAHGDLFGMTGQEAGAAYELTPANGNWSFTLLQTFTGEYPGPLSGPTLDAHGNLYGPLPTGGPGEGDGQIFELTPSDNGWIYTPFFDFDVYDGALPIGSVTFDASGNMYGTTVSGGWGTVWEITP